jgi:phage pi2 protein 07
MAKLRANRLDSLVQTTSHFGWGREDIVKHDEYQIIELAEPHAWFLEDFSAGQHVYPISCSKQLAGRPERYHWLLSGIDGGIIFWGETRNEVIRFITHNLRKEITDEVKA